MAQDTQELNYLYDFIYLDRPRIASYFAQLFEESGLLTNLKTVSQTGTASGYKANAGIPSILGGEATGSDSNVHSLERHFDPAWIIPINVLGGLKDSNFINDSLDATPIGQLALVKGQLRILDVRMMKELWPSAFGMMTMDEHPITSADKKRYQARKKEWDTLSSVISKLPHALQMTFTANRLEAWSTLSPEHMTINPEDFALKHGANIQGEWYMIGIVDAIPDATDIDAPDLSSELEAGMLTMLAAIRTMFGRPAHAYGVTPIAIYRPLQNK